MAPSRRQEAVNQLSTIQRQLQDLAEQLEQQALTDHSTPAANESDTVEAISDAVSETSSERLSSQASASLEDNRTSSSCAASIHGDRDASRGVSNKLTIRTKHFSMTYTIR